MSCRPVLRRGGNGYDRRPFSGSRVSMKSNVIAAIVLIRMIGKNLTDKQ